MVIETPDGKPLKVAAKVVWTTISDHDDGRTRLGTDVEFVYITEADRLFLRDAISRHYEQKFGRPADEL